MVKVGCCVPGCTNNWRNSPTMKFHTLPSDPKVKNMYEKLIRNKTLRLNAPNTRICGAHFPGGERMSRTQLPSIFPWTSTPKERRAIKKHELPVKEKVIDLQHMNNESETCLSTMDSTATIDTDLDLGNDTSQDSLFKDAATQTEDEQHHLREEIAILEAKIQTLEKEIHNFNTKPKFDIEDHKDIDENITFYTGFQNYETLELCFDMVREQASNLCYSGGEKLCFPAGYNKPGSKRKLNTWQEFTMVLLRLRLGLLEKDLAERYRVSVASVSIICRTWIKFLRKELQPRCIQWPSKEQLFYYMPPVFKSFYPDLVSIIDCTEFQMESPSSLDNKSLCYSSYKSRPTMKAFIGITPNGVVSFSSDLYCGSISDPEIVRKSGYLTYLNRGDVVMTDKGFTIQDELASVGEKLAMPHFLKGKKQFTKAESEHNKKIASLRIHVERYMERIKNWHIFDRPIPISMSDIASDIWIVVVCLSNFLPPIVS